jgi:heterodisulfide reductase subunit C
MRSASDASLSALLIDGALLELENAAGVGLSGCLQCQKCTSGCPVAVESDLRPHEVIRLVQLGAKDEVLASRFIWECTSCETCLARCPQAIDLPTVVDALRRLSLDSRTVAEPAVSTFNGIFLALVREMGRTNELALMAAFKMRTRRFSEDVGKFPMMLRKGKFALLPAFVKGRKGRKRAFRRSRELGGKR